MKEIVLTGKEIKALYDFSFVNECTGYTSNVVIQSIPTPIGAVIKIQTQDDYNEGKKDWSDITDYESL